MLSAVLSMQTNASEKATERTENQRRRRIASRCVVHNWASKWDSKRENVRKKEMCEREKIIVIHDFYT